MTTHLQREMAKLRKRLVELSAEVEQSIEMSYEALAKLDATKATEIIDRDSVIDDMEVDIEEECLKIMALYQPVATDLRFVVAVLKINNDLERMGDLATSIAQYVIEIQKLELVSIPDRFSTIFTKALKQVRHALDAMVNTDTNLASQVRRDDEVIDELYEGLLAQLRQALRDDQTHLNAYLYMISICHCVERIGDYATNIAEDVVYMARGRIVRHLHRDDELQNDDKPATRK